MLFIRTILSLSLATFSLAIPVAQPHAVGDLGGVGTSCLSQYALHTNHIDSTFVSGLIRRDDVQVFQDLEGIINTYLDDSVTAHVLDQGVLDRLIGKVQGITQDSIAEVEPDGFFSADDFNHILQMIESDINSDLSDAIALSNSVSPGTLNQNIVDELIQSITNEIRPSLTGA